MYTDDRQGYPAHGVRRYTAALYAIQGLSADAVGMVNSVRRLRALETRSQALSLVQLACMVEVAGWLWATEPTSARRLLTYSQTERPGLIQLLPKFLKVSEIAPQMHAKVQATQAAVEEALAPSGAASSGARGIGAALVQAVRWVSY